MNSLQLQPRVSFDGKLGAAFAVVELVMLIIIIINIDSQRGALVEPENVWISLIEAEQVHWGNSTARHYLHKGSNHIAW